MAVVFQGGLSHKLFGAESHKIRGPRLAPGMWHTLKLLWLIYLLFTALIAGALLLCGMSPFDALAHALTCTIPYHGTLFTAEETHRTILAQAAEKRETKLVCVSTEEQIGPALEQQIPAWIHAENLALALAICEHVGAPRDAALRGMLSITEDSGSFRIIHLAANRKPVYFVNAFSGNDPISTKIMLEKTLSSLEGASPLVGLFNHRKDRFFRAQTFAEFARKAMFNRLFLIGDRLSDSQRLFPGATDLSEIHRAAPLWERIQREIEGGSIIFGFGNIAGIALRLNEHLQRISEEV